MPPLLIPLAKLMVGALSATACVTWAVRETRRLNAELERARTAPAIDPRQREALPTLRRDPATGEWRVR